MSLLDRPANWCATRPLMAAVILTSVVTIPTAFNLEQRMDEKVGKNAERIEEVKDQVDDEVPGTESTTPGDDEAPSGDGTTTSTGTTEPGTPPTTQAPAIEITDEQILQVIREFCMETDCRPIFVDEREVQEGEIQNDEINDLDPDDPELQQDEIQDPPVPGPIGPVGPAGPICPAGYEPTDIRIPSVSKDRTLTARVCMKV